MDLFLPSTQCWLFSVCWCCLRNRSFQRWAFHSAQSQTCCRKRTSTSSKFWPTFKIYITLSSSLLMWTFRHSTSLLWWKKKKLKHKYWPWKIHKYLDGSFTGGLLSLCCTSLVQLVWVRPALSWASLDARRVSSSSSVRDLLLAADRWALHTPNNT